MEDRDGQTFEARTVGILLTMENMSITRYFYSMDFT